MQKTDKQDVISLMIKQESLLAKLYTLFAEQFPEHREAWSELAEEEKKHANWLRQLDDAVEKGIVGFEGGRFKAPALKVYIAHLEQIVARAEKKELTLTSAVSYTVDFERSLIEKNVFTHFDSASEKARSVLNRLKSETEAHIRKIQTISP